MTQKIVLLPNVEPKDQPGNVLNWRALQLSLKYLVAAFGTGGTLGVANRVLFYDASGNLTSSVNLTFDGSILSLQNALAIGANAISGIGTAKILSVSGDATSTQEVIRLQTGQATGAAADYMFVLARHRNSGGANIDGGSIRFTCVNPANGVRTSKVGFYGSNNEVQTLGFEVGADGTSTASADLKIGTVGKGLYIKEGTNATMGNGQLAGGVLVVSTTKVTANSEIFIGDKGGGVLANAGALYEDSAVRVAGTSFTVKSLNILDTSKFCWLICEPS